MTPEETSEEPQQQQLPEESNETNEEEPQSSTTKSAKAEKAKIYLKLWKKQRDCWKFNKCLHIWLLRNWKNDEKLSDKYFKIFLKYLHAQQIQSKALERIKKEAQSFIDNNNNISESSPSTLSSSEKILERSRSILQWLT